MVDIASIKREMRAEQDKKRKLLLGKFPNAATQLRTLFLKQVELPSRCAVSSYSARGCEINPSPTAVALQNKGHVICLPVVTGPDNPLTFKKYFSGDKLQIGHMGIPEPLPDAPIIEPDVLLVPLLAFDLNGYRLGYGGGFYDRTLNDLHARKHVLAIGIAYDGQEVPEIPVEPHDMKLDKIVTETRILENFLP